MTDMNKTYDPHTIEATWYSLWEEQGYFKPSGKGESYCIHLPPPNVTGHLHMGHGFQQTLMDILIRYHRMLGENVLWQGGTDHAGIATQMVVERQLLKDNVTRHDLGRETFINKIWSWKQASGSRITEQMRRLGLSIDWSRERFTMDPELSHAVKMAFIKLHEEGLIYRGKRLVNWDPVLLTAVSDLEVEHREKEGFLYVIRYVLVDDPEKSLMIATTRPETLLGDVALAVNPLDERYTEFVGKQVHVPLTDRIIPIIADDYVDFDFGTGVVKITPAHDFNDYALSHRHGLPSINIFTPQATLNENTPKPYQGLDRFDARKKIVDDLKKENLWVREEKHMLKVPCGDRSQAVLEPYLTDQWFLNVEEIGKEALSAVKEGHIQFVPKGWENEYFHWMENLQDWCISRQLWWGHRIPAWYDEKNAVYVGETEEQVREKYQLSEEIKLHQDTDVLDTWFSSALWPFSTLGWPEQTSDLQTFYPGSVLITGFDIIFFWVARMIMFGLKFTNQIPFHHVYITGLIRDAEGQKMSKTKGNVLDPLDIIDGITLADLVEKRTQGLMQPVMEKRIKEATKRDYPEGISAFGTDALRFTYCALASNTRDINFDLARVAGYRNFCNKLWNASRFVLMSGENFPDPVQPKEYHFVDRWIMAKLQLTIADCRRYIKEYRFDLLAQTLYEFVWNEFCDWYLELSKPILNEVKNTETHNATRYTLRYVLDQIVRLLHPIMPFITEEIWQRVKIDSAVSEKSIMLSAYPDVCVDFQNEFVLADMNWLKEVIVTIRTLRSQSQIPPGKQVTVYLLEGTQQDQEKFLQFKSFIVTLARLQDLCWEESKKELPLSITGLANNMTVLIPMSDFINKEQEISRLQKEIEKIKKERIRCLNKLNNPAYIEKAPQAVVDKERVQATMLEDNLMKLQTQVDEVNRLA